MSMTTRSTLRMLCARADGVRKETMEEAQRLLDLYYDPTVSIEKKESAKVELDKIIKELEERVTTRRLREVKKIDIPKPPVL